MQYSEIVTVSERFQRSIRIDTDINDLETIRSYHCPASSAEVLITMGENFSTSGQAAFTWTGPYGSGKSSLAVALASLIDGDTKAREAAKKSIGARYSNKLVKLFNAENGEWEFLPIIGHKGDPEEAVIEALEGSGYILKRKAGATATVKELQKIIEKTPKRIFIVIDEMGKFLEAASSGGADIYFFQQLAELASRSNGKLIVLGILHQSFAEYARKLTREIRDEWTKIQGRFVDIPLNVAGEEQLELISRAIKSDKKPKIASQLACYVADNISGNRPVNKKIIAENMTQTWPLNPIVSCLLGPISRRRFGQNQRSVFGFLNSAEPHGFQSFLKNSEYKKDLLYRPALLWDYLRANLEPSILASPDGHRWALAVDALNRCEARGGDKQHIELVKCIALIEMFKERSGLSPEPELLLHCVPDLNKAQFNKALKDLEQWSIILFKKHLKAYSIYAGSDFDIEAAVNEASIEIADLDIEDIKKIAGFQPVVAKRHYHTTGAFRWFEIDLVPASQAIDFATSFNPKNGATGLFLVVLPTGEEDHEKIEKICRNASKVNETHPVIASYTQDSWLIRQHAKELKALEWIKNNSPSLGGDSVARKEVEQRIASNSETLEDYLTKCFTGAQWYVSGRKRVIADLKGLNELVSDFSDTIYAESPIINSELVNRIKPSSNANAALKQLLIAMVSNYGKERLGIEGYPAEGGLFETLLAATCLYRKSKEGEWGFRDTTNSDPARIKPLWKAADKLFKKESERQVTLTELYEVWEAEPYGVKEGLLPFFAVSYMLTRINEFAIYLEGTYRATPDDLLIDHLMKNPGGISLRKMDFSEIGQNILIGVIDAVNSVNSNSAPLSEKSPPLQIARQLVSTVLGLHPWVLRTRTLSKNTIKVRELIKNASDPNKVLFDDLPELFSEHQEALNKGDVTPIIKTLKESLTELVEAYPALLSDMHKQILTELQVKDATKKSLAELHDRAENTLGISGDFRLDAFAGRLRTYTGTNEDIEGIASLAANRPAQDWIDLDVNKAKLQIAELAQKFNHIEAFGRVQNRKDNRHAVAFVVGLDDRAKTFAHEFVVRDADKKAVHEIETQLEQVLNSYPDIEPELMYAALAKLGARLLQGYSSDEPAQRKVS